MEIFGAIVLIALSFTAFIFMWHLESFNSFFFTPFLVIMAFEFIRILPAFFYASFTGITDLYPLLIFFLGFSSIIFGFLMILGILNYRRTTHIQFVESKISRINRQEIKFFLFWGGALLIIVGLYRYQGMPPIFNALSELIGGDVYNEIIRGVGAERKLITKGHYFGMSEYRGQGITKAITVTLWPFLTMLAFSLYYYTKKYFWLTTFFLLVFLSFLFVSGDGTRGPFLNGLACVFVLYSYMNKLKFKILLKGCFLIFLVAIIISLLSPKLGNKLSKDNFLFTAFQKISQRILIDNAINDVYAIELIRDGTFNHRLGMLHIRDIKAAIPGANAELPFAHELFLEKSGSKAGKVKSTYATGTYITKVFVDFGVPGIVFVFGMIGIVVGFIQCIMFKINKNIINLVLVSLISYNLGQIVLSGPISAIISILIVIFFYSFLKLIYYFFKKASAVNLVFFREKVTTKL